MSSCYQSRADRGAGQELPQGPGQVPIGIRPTMKAQSAMLREMYHHHGSMAAGPVRPLAVGASGL